MRLKRLMTRYLKKQDALLKAGKRLRDVTLRSPEIVRNREKEEEWLDAKVNVDEAKSLIDREGVQLMLARVLEWSIYKMCRCEWKRVPI